ncbi:MAG TPA: cytochrome c oxidase subunit 3 [Pirellulales bacterium]|jgi:cytochrome c oxidase subunit 3|nr:cytochrome c oxidase subunit 3 [Pirellulales bacterium]
MSSEGVVLTSEARQTLDGTLLVRHRLEEQYADLEQQHETAAFGMWVFLATEVMFFGVLFLGVEAYHYMYPEAFEAASEKLNWVIGGINTLVLLLSSLTAVLAVHYSKLGDRRRVMICLGVTALLGVVFLCFKGLEYYDDYVDKLIPGWSFDDSEWVREEGLKPVQVPHVKLFLLFYWIMTGLHGLHVIIGIVAMLVMLELARRKHFSPTYYSPIDVTALYWHFVDIVWIFLLPTLYLMGTHK